METVVTDVNGERIVVGDRVAIPHGEIVDGKWVATGEITGVITSISDPDGDVDDEGRQYGISPRVYVQFGPEDGDDFGTSWTAKGWWDEDAPYQCDDVEFVERREGITLGGMSKP